MIGTRIGARVGALIGARVGLISDGGAPTTTTLTVAISDSADPVIGGANFSYAVVVTNTGSIEASTVEAVIVLDATLAFVSASGTGWTCNAVGQTVTCTRAALAVGAAPTITVTVTSASASSTESTTADADASNSAAATQDIETTVVTSELVGLFDPELNSLAWFSEEFTTGQRGVWDPDLVRT